MSTDAPATSKPPLAFQIPIDAAEAAFVRRLSAQVRGGAPGPDATMAGEGFNNWIWRLEIPGGVVAIKLGKPHRGPAIAEEHAKEMWCANAALAAGVSTPPILAAETFEARPYQVQAFVAGRMPLAEEHGVVWAQMGRWARMIHDVPVAGMGMTLVEPGVFGGSWREHVARSLAALTPDDPLLAMGVLTPDTAADLRSRFEDLAARDFRIGLTHADFAPWNVLAEEVGGALTLIDWGCAGAAPVPHHEFGELIRSERVNAEELDIFRRAYGLSDEAFADVMADLPDLLALREIDVMRWGLTARPNDVEKLVRRVARALKRLETSDA